MVFLVTSNCSKVYRVTYQQWSIFQRLLWLKTQRLPSSLQPQLVSAAVLAAFEPPYSVVADLFGEVPNHALRFELTGTIDVVTYQRVFMAV